MHATERLLSAGHQVVGVDSLSDYYSVALKRARLSRLIGHSGFEFHEFDLAHLPMLQNLFGAHRFDRVLHLAAQAGVRYSLVNPHAYVSSNLAAFVNLLECCRYASTAHLVYASSSSVYGANTQQPFSTKHAVDHQVSLYGATKRANELIAHSYSHLFALPTTGLRFFTVYGPWGRPDMFATLFTDAILKGQPIKVFNRGEMRRDFTYVDDIVEGVARLLDYVPNSQNVGQGSTKSPAQSHAPFQVFNIGNSNSVPLLEVIAHLEQAVGKKASLDLQPMQAGDVVETSADVSDLETAIDFRPSTPVAEGLKRYVEWHTRFYGNDPAL
jgi:UDP-glucuronate 4-epimerase